MGENNGLATAEQLRASGGKVVRRFKELDPLPVNGMKFRIQSMTEGELSKYQLAVVASRGQGIVRARMEDAERRLFVHCLVDAEGNRMLNNSETAIFVDWDSADSADLFNACAGHCGVTRDDIEQLAAHKTSVKNSSETTAGS